MSDTAPDTAASSPATAAPAHRMTYRPPNARVGCSCTWVSDHPDIITDPALWEAHLEVELAKVSIVITQLPARSGDPFRARDIVSRAAKMREAEERDKGVRRPIGWSQCTDAQKVHWILAAAASIPTKETPNA